MNACKLVILDSLVFFKKTLYSPFLWMGFNCHKATGPLQGDSLLFTTTPPGVPGIQ